MRRESSPHAVTTATASCLISSSFITPLFCPQPPSRKVRQNLWRRRLRASSQASHPANSQNFGGGVGLLLTHPSSLAQVGDLSAGILPASVQPPIALPQACLQALRAVRTLVNSQNLEQRL